MTTRPLAARSLQVFTAFIVTFFALPALAQDQGQFGKVIRIEANAFQGDAGRITFSENPVGTKNPVYRPRNYGARDGGVSVIFGAFFDGQYLGNPAQCPPGANPDGCVVGTALSPLRLARNAPPTFIAEDGSNPNSPSLSGSPRFNGPVSMVFDKDVAGVGLAGGFFNAVRSTAIQAFDRNGVLIGGVKNLREGMEYLALVTEDGANRIAGLQFSLVGAEPAGYAIDDLTFALASQLNRSQIPLLADVLAAPAVKAPANGAAPAAPTGSLSNLFGTPPANNAGTPAPSPAPALAPTPAPSPGGGGSLSDLFNNN